MSQQGVSRLVHSLETELGVPLFYRGAQGIKLTEEGKLLKKHAEPLCREYQLLLEEIEAGRQAGKPLRLGITSGILFAAQDGLTSLEQQNITLIDTYDDLCDEMVLEGSVSMGIGVEPVDHTRFEVTPLARYPLYLICGRTIRWPAALRSPLMIWAGPAPVPSGAALQGHPQAAADFGQPSHSQPDPSRDGLYDEHIPALPTDRLRGAGSAVPQLRHCTV